MADVFSEISKMFEDNSIDFNNSSHTNNIGFQQSKIRKQILRYIKDNGYLPVRTVLSFKSALFDKRTHLPECTDAEIDQITEATQTLGVSD